jgi:hypothetical protein
MKTPAKRFEDWYALQPRGTPRAKALYTWRLKRAADASRLAELVDMATEDFEWATEEERLLRTTTPR